MGIYSPDTRIHALNQDQDSKQHMPLDNANVVLLVSQNRHFVTTFRTQYERDGDRHGALWERILPGSGEVDDRKAYCRQKFDSACKRRDELLAQMATSKEKINPPPDLESLATKEQPAFFVPELQKVVSHGQILETNVSGASAAAVLDEPTFEDGTHVESLDIESAGNRSTATELEANKPGANESNAIKPSADEPAAEEPNVSETPGNKATNSVLSRDEVANNVSLSNNSVTKEQPRYHHGTEDQAMSRSSNIIQDRNSLSVAPQSQEQQSMVQFLVGMPGQSTVPYEIRTD